MNIPPHIDPPDIKNIFDRLFKHESPPDEDLLEKRNRILELYEDPEWMKQAAFGDMEFEMDLAEYFKENKDKLGLMGLRRHVQEGGPKRWLDLTPLDVFPGSQIPMFWPTRMEESGDRRSLGWFTEGNDRGPRRIDLNLENLIDMDERSEEKLRGKVPHAVGEDWSLKNAIFDLYSHELGHGVPGLNEFRDLDLEHPAIYYNTYLHGKHPGIKEHGFFKSENWPRRWEMDDPRGIGPWNEFDPRPNVPARYTKDDYLDRSMHDIVEDVLSEATQYQGRSKIDEMSTRRQEYDFIPRGGYGPSRKQQRIKKYLKLRDDPRGPGPWNEFDPRLNIPDDRLINRGGIASL